MGRTHDRDWIRILAALGLALITILATYAIDTPHVTADSTPTAQTPLYCYPPSVELTRTTENGTSGRGRGVYANQLRVGDVFTDTMTIHSFGVTNPSKVQVMGDWSANTLEWLGWSSTTDTQFRTVDLDTYFFEFDTPDGLRERVKVEITFRVKALDTTLREPTALHSVIYAFHQPGWLPRLDSERITSALGNFIPSRMNKPCPA